MPLSIHTIEKWPSPILSSDAKQQTGSCGNYIQSTGCKNSRNINNSSYIFITDFEYKCISFLTIQICIEYSESSYQFTSRTEIQSASCGDEPQLTSSIQCVRVNDHFSGSHSQLIDDQTLMSFLHNVIVRRCRVPVNPSFPADRKFA